ncbi:MAG: hypothetical protein ACTSVC_12865 [Promethearchaeota archaeon]
MELTIKIFDSVILIRFLIEVQFKELFEKWFNHRRQEYIGLVPYEVLSEFKRNKEELENLIINKLLEVIPKVSDNELNRLNQKYPYLSKADCAVLYHGGRYRNAICLTDDGRLRKELEKQNIRKSGTKGIYQKLLSDNEFEEDFIEQMFSNFKKDRRIFP